MEEGDSPYGGPPAPQTEVLFVNQADSQPKRPPHRVLGGRSPGQEVRRPGFPSKH